MAVGGFVFAYNLDEFDPNYGVWSVTVPSVSGYFFYTDDPDTGGYKVTDDFASGIYVDSSCDTAVNSLVSITYPTFAIDSQSFEGQEIIIPEYQSVTYRTPFNETDWLIITALAQDNPVQPLLTPYEALGFAISLTINFRDTLRANIIPLTIPISATLESGEVIASCELRVTPIYCGDNPPPPDTGGGGVATYSMDANPTGRLVKARIDAGRANIFFSGAYDGGSFAAAGSSVMAGDQGVCVRYGVTQGHFPVFLATCSADSSRGETSGAIKWWRSDDEGITFTQIGGDIVAAGAKYPAFVCLPTGAVPWVWIEEVSDGADPPVLTYNLMAQTFDTERRELTELTQIAAGVNNDTAALCYLPAGKHRLLVAYNGNVTKFSDDLGETWAGV